MRLAPGPVFWTKPVRGRSDGAGIHCEDSFLIAKPVSPLIQELDAKSFTVIGSPCSDGYGAEALHHLQTALTGAKGDFVTILGDVSPLGRDPYYLRIARFIDRYSDRPVHVMRGNHDGPDFSAYFGHADRAVITEEFAVIMLDNSDRRFSDDTLRFFWETIAISEKLPIILAFHVPPPNRISGDSMSVEEWARFEEAVGIWRNRISLVLCGHGHTYFEDDIDGLRLVVSGGGGANIRALERVVSPPHHALEVSIGPEGKPIIVMRRLEPSHSQSGAGELQDMLEQIYRVQCRNYTTMKLRAEEEDTASGRPEMARLLRAGSECCLAQARILYGLLEKDPATLLSFEDGDGKEILTKRVAAADAANDLLIMRVMVGVAGAEKVFAGLLTRAEKELAEGTSDIRATGYYLCGSCGVMFAGLDTPNYCETCGAPGYSFMEVR